MNARRSPEQLAASRVVIWAGGFWCSISAPVESPAELSRRLQQLIQGLLTLALD
jgi:hypothetical protein